MDRRIRVLAVFLGVCFLVLAAQLSNLQIRQAAALRKSPYEPHAVQDAFAGDRGEILSADGYVLAKSVLTKNGYQRIYPQGSLFADITGYVNVVNSNISTGLEAEYGNPLGTSAKSQYLLMHEYPGHGLSGLLTQRKGTDSITITVSRRLQLVARQALGSLRGALVAIDPRNGDILAMYSSPSFNPNKLASLNPKTVTAYYKSLDPASGSSPLVNTATQEPSAPGSTFKIITSSAIFNHRPSIASQYWKPVSGVALPNTTAVLHNYASEVCGGTLAQVFAQSCDSAFGLIGLELGRHNLASEANAFGLNRPPPIDLPADQVSPGYFPPASHFSAQDPFLAYSAIGQANVAETPLEDVLVAATIADGGTTMTPHLLSRVIDNEGNIVATYHPHAWLHPDPPSTAAAVHQLMLGVTRDPNGTAYGVFPSSLEVAAKTGTAQAGLTGCSNNWLVAFAPAGPGQTPSVAVAGFVPYQPGLSCSATGAGVAGPRVAQLLEAALAQQAAAKP